MKNSIKIAFFSLLSISFFSCEKEVEIDIDEEEQKLVLNTWLKPNESPEVQISYSSFIFNKRGTGFIDNARVLIFEDGIEMGELNHINQGFYNNESIELKAGSNYEFEVLHDDYQRISSTEKIPSNLQDNEVEIAYEINPNGSYSSNSYNTTVTIKIQDDGNEENYYLARVAQRTTYWNMGDEDTTSVRNFVYLEPIDPQTQDTYLPNSGGHFILSDDIFNGKEYEMKLGAYNDLRSYESISDDSTYYQATNYEIEFHKINRALYLYLITIDNNQYPGPFTEPTQMYSNIENGYGIFATSSYTTYIIEEPNDSWYY
ncbi:hypothetical protein MATR_08180 [Marivirga tractuosa]|uniref:DUF4249 domain-containing protein n=1 Tax=Marivirga tractuosa (strain ATCC 23168 / DSM 4126 / NBRC 15989 / NCIMB 1408 / VKM B-1430 / H-43) TaxID=643867 RepID=E4TPG4_MARTH|nr:DUF4249 domain-containing protein [Marivirga tractuosa]ADR21552.1 hypothetical protein Ftrac_1562 [Marivirga tractuosa DSM 4126]BDD13993.1 hypothetical protein MATR_08180 [Marivirga tractuosa]